MYTRTVESPRRTNPLPTLATLAVLAGAALLPSSARGQDWDAMQRMLQQQNAALDQQIQQRLAQQNATVAAAQQRATQVVQQAMQDPTVQAAYQQHLAQAAQRGAQPYDFPTFAYYYVATRGFSAEGTAAWSRTQQDIQRKEQRARQGVREAEAATQRALSDMHEGYSRNQQEAGLGLRGQSTFVTPEGQPQALPHTWERNTTTTYQGHTYHVNETGQYWLRDPNNSGYWIPLQPAR